MGFEIAIVVLAVIGFLIVKSINVVPQQNAWVVERVGKYHETLTPGLHFVLPFIKKVAY